MKTALARDLIREDTNSDGLVDSNPSGCRDPIADSHHVSAADRVDRICLLYAGWLIRGGRRGLVHSVVVRMLQMNWCRRSGFVGTIRWLAWRQCYTARKPN